MFVTKMGNIRKSLARGILECNHGMSFRGHINMWRRYLCKVPARFMVSKDTGGRCWHSSCDASSRLHTVPQCVIPMPLITSARRV